MFRGVSALLIRMLREDAMRLRLHLGRIGFLGLTVFPLISTYASMNRQSAAGLGYFQAIIWLDLIFLLTVTSGLYSSAICEEREQGTLGLLKMTGVSRLAILLGKSTSRLITTLGFLLIQLPFVALSVTMGGVSLNQVLSAMFSIGAFSILLCNWGLFCSLACNTTRAASFLTGFWIWAYLLLPRVLGWILSGVAPLLQAGVLNRCLTWVLDVIAEVNETTIFNRLAVIQQTGFSGDYLSLQVVSNMAAGMLLFGISWLLFERWTRNPEPVIDQRSSLLYSRIGFRRKQPQARVSGRVWRNPFAWQEYSFVQGGNSRWFLRWIVPPCLAGLVIVCMHVMVAWSLGTIKGPTIEEQVEIFVGTILGITAVFFAAESLSGSSRMFGDEYREGTLTTLLLLPLSIGHVELQKVLGEVRGMIPYFFWGVVSLICTIWMSPESAFENLSTNREILFFVFSAIGGYLLLYQLIIWYSVHVKRGAMGFGFLTAYLGTAFFSLTCLFGGYLLNDFFGIDLDTETEQFLVKLLAVIFLVMFNILFHVSFLRRVRVLGERSGV